MKKKSELKILSPLFSNFFSINSPLFITIHKLISLIIEEVTLFADTIILPILFQRTTDVSTNFAPS